MVWYLDCLRGLGSWILALKALVDLLTVEEGGN